MGLALVNETTNKEIMGLARDKHRILRYESKIPCSLLEEVPDGFRCG